MKTQKEDLSWVPFGDVWRAKKMKEPKGKLIDKYKACRIHSMNMEGVLISTLAYLEERFHLSSTDQQQKIKRVLEGGKHHG